ncbi:hypothetical protein YC2023_012261 [Brassica napus]
MEGVPIGRNLENLSHMFYTYFNDNRDRKQHVLTYQEKDGDWMMVGDIPWETRTLLGSTNMEQGKRMILFEIFRLVFLVNSVHHRVTEPVSSPVYTNWKARIKSKYNKIHSDTIQK